MIDTSWRIEDPDPVEPTAGSTSSGFVSLHFLRSALRRLEISPAPRLC